MVRHQRDWRTRRWHRSEGGQGHRIEAARAADAYWPKTDLHGAMNGDLVVRRWLDLQAVMAAIVSEVPRKCPDCIGTNTAASGKRPSVSSV